MADEDLLHIGFVAFLRSIPTLADTSIKIEPATGSQSSTLPRLRYVRLGEAANHLSNDGPSNLKRTMIQLDVIDANYTAAHRVAAAVLAKDGFRGSWGPRILVGLFRAESIADAPQTPTGGTDKAPFVERLSLSVWHSLKE